MEILIRTPHFEVIIDTQEYRFLDRELRKKIESGDAKGALNRIKQLLKDEPAWVSKTG